MLTIKVPLKDAQKVKKQLLAKGIFAHGYELARDKSHLYLPVSKRFKSKHTFEEKRVKKLAKRETAKETLTKKLTKKEQNLLKTALDIIGTIAIVEIDPELRKREKIIAEAILESHKGIKTVLRKSGAHKGTFRLQKYKFLAGERTKETIHRETGVRLKLHVEKTYFSPRLSTERKRIANQIKKGESVLIMFSGAGPYPCVLAKNTNAKEVYGVEINPEAHSYAVESVKLNKLKNVKLYCGDVKKVLPKISKKFDRIAMPLPMGAGEFLATALKKAKKGTIIHFYDFLHEDQFVEAKDKIKEACKQAKKKCRILRTVKCGQFAPHVFRICVDFKVL